MVETNGKFLIETLNSLDLQGEFREKAIENAQKILVNVKSATGPDAIGLVYGRIQSGKTRAMITSTAMAFDNGYRIVIVMTSNINDLVTQTHFDFAKDLKGVSVFTKDDELGSHIEDAQLDLERNAGRILIVASKGTQSLKNITSFLRQIGAASVPSVIFDDEGDQASLDANTYKRSRKGGDLTLQPTAINRLIAKLRKELPASVYVSVTGTPQAVLLQSASSNNRPSFVSMLPPGNGYVGGDHFFNEVDPKSNGLVSIIPDEDKTDLLNARRPIPVGLKDSLLFFILSAAAAAHNLGYPTTGREKDKGYQFLCHPSLKNNEQASAAQRIADFLTQVKRVLLGHPDSTNILSDMQAQYEILKAQLGADTTPGISELKTIIEQELLRKKILVINSTYTKRHGIEYGPGFNFLIGGNTLGRGIAIPNLLVTYYIRSARTSQIDTMHQHARMFGYRTKTLKYTRLFITNTLYSRFRDIHYSDQGLRNFIEMNAHSFPNAFPVEIATGLRATRTGVLNAESTETVYPGQQIYPNYMKLPQPERSYNKVIEMVGEGLNVTDVRNRKEMSDKGKDGVVITSQKAIEIVSHVKTSSQNSWHDKTIADVLTKLSQRLGDGVKLKFRNAQRNVGPGGFLSSGTISGPEQEAGRTDSIPTLWIMSVTDTSGAFAEPFVFPTIIVPNGLPNVFVFSKK